MNDQELLQTNYSPEQLEEITGVEKHIHNVAKQQRCDEAYRFLQEVLPDMTGMMMEKVKRSVNEEMKRRKELK